MYAMHSVWYTAVIKMCQVYPAQTNCSYYHCQYNVNRCIAELSSRGDSRIQQTGLAQKDLRMVVLMRMALIVT